MWGPLILTGVVPLGGALCEVTIYRYDNFGSGGTCGCVVLHSYCCLVVGYFPDRLHLYWLLHWFDLKNEWLFV